MRHHLILDLETLGVGDSAVILSVGALLYFPDEQKTITQSWKLDSKEQITKYNRTVSQDTLNWWKQQEEAAFRVLHPKPDDWKSKDFLEDLFAWLKTNGYEWSKTSTWLEGTILQRGTIDHAMIANLAKNVYGSEEALYDHLSWKKVRDIRTIIDMVNTSLYTDVNVYSVPAADCVQEKTQYVFDDWWSYLEDYKRHYKLIPHDAVSDCIIQLESLRMIDFC